MTLVCVPRRLYRGACGVRFDRNTLWLTRAAYTALGKAKRLSAKAVSEGRSLFLAADPRGDLRVYPDGRAAATNLVKAMQIRRGGYIALPCRGGIMVDMNRQYSRRQSRDKAIAASALACDNCGRTILESDMRKVYPDIPDLLTRIAPGEPVPYGECPRCGCLVHAKEAPQRVLVRVRGGVAVVEHVPHGVTVEVQDYDTQGVEGVGADGAVSRVYTGGAR